MAIPKGLRILFSHTKAPARPSDEEILAAWDQINAILDSVNNRPVGWTEIMRLTDLEMQVRRIEDARAEKRSKALLLEHLTEEQQKDLKKTREFRIKPRTNIYAIDDLGRVHLVSHPDNARIYMCASTIGHDLPGCDKSLAMKLFIEANEEEFLKIANVMGNLGLKLDLEGNITQTSGRSRRPVRVNPFEQAPVPATDYVHEWRRLDPHLTVNQYRTLNTWDLDTTFTGNGTIQQIRLDATAFGDTNETYLTGLREHDRT